MKYLSAGRILLLSIFAIAVSACSETDSISEDSIDFGATSEVSIGFSDAPIGDLSSVTLAVDKIIFKVAGQDITVDRFTSEDLGVDDADSFTIDLLEVQGLENKLVIDSVDLPIGTYQDLRLVIDESQSFVNEVAGTEDFELKVPSGVLKLGGFTVEEESTQTFIVEFGLTQAMTYNPGNGNKDPRYILKPRGVRILSLEKATSISGTVDLAATTGCLVEGDATVYRTAYLYQGTGLDSALLGDVFVREDDSEEPEIDENVPANIIAPYVAAPIDAATGEFIFSYLEPGDYSVAIACQLTEDDPVIYNEIAIPSPAGELIETSLLAGLNYQCDFPVDGSCSAFVEMFIPELRPFPSTSSGYYQEVISSF